MVVRPFVLALCSVSVLVACRSDPVDVDPVHVEPVRVEPGAPSHAPAGSSGEPRALRVLHVWDGRRAAAYARGDVATLRDLYVPRSRAGRRDASVLGQYAARGLVVRDLRVQVVRFDVRRDEPRLVEVVVRERLSGTVQGRGTRRALPRDRADTHVVVLARRQGSWRLVSATRP